MHILWLMFPSKREVKMVGSKLNYRQFLFLQTPSGSFQCLSREPNRKIVRRRTWVGRMAVSRTERRWSKEPRLETTLSVIVWLFCSDSLIFAALSLSESVPATATPIFFFFFLLLLRKGCWERERINICKSKNWHFFVWQGVLFSCLVFEAWDLCLVLV